MEIGQLLREVIDLKRKVDSMLGGCYVVQAIPNYTGLQVIQSLSAGDYLIIIRNGVPVRILVTDFLSMTIGGHIEYSNEYSNEYH